MFRQIYKLLKVKPDSEFYIVTRSTQNRYKRESDGTYRIYFELKKIWHPVQLETILALFACGGKLLNYNEYEYYIHK